MAESEITEGTIELGNIQSIADAISLATADHHPFNLPVRSESVIRGAGCLNWASPDL